jgi:hypothetical protein
MCCVCSDDTEEKVKLLTTVEETQPTKMGKSRMQLVSRKLLRAQSKTPGGPKSRYTAQNMKFIFCKPIYLLRENVVSPRSTRPGTKLSSSIDLVIHEETD